MTKLNPELRHRCLEELGYRNQLNTVGRPRNWNG
jgi:hypothetical protein